MGEVVDIVAIFRKLEKNHAKKKSKYRLKCCEIVYVKRYIKTCVKHSALYRRQQPVSWCVHRQWIGRVLVVWMVGLVGVFWAMWRPRAEQNSTVSVTDTMSRRISRLRELLERELLQWVLLSLFVSCWESATRAETEIRPNVRIRWRRLFAGKALVQLVYTYHTWMGEWLARYILLPLSILPRWPRHYRQAHK